MPEGEDQSRALPEKASLCPPVLKHTDALGEKKGAAHLRHGSRRDRGAQGETAQLAARKGSPERAGRPGATGPHRLRTPTAAQPPTHPSSSPRGPGPPKRVPPSHGVGSGEPRPDPHPGTASCNGVTGRRVSSAPLAGRGGRGVLELQVVFGPGHLEGISDRGGCFKYLGPKRARLSDPRPGRDSTRHSLSHQTPRPGRAADDYTSQDPPRPRGQGRGAPITHHQCPNAPRLRTQRQSPRASEGYTAEDLPRPPPRGLRRSPHALLLPECQAPAYAAPEPGGLGRRHFLGLHCGPHTTTPRMPRDHSKIPLASTTTPIMPHVPSLTPRLHPQTCYETQTDCGPRTSATNHQRRRL